MIASYGRKFVDTIARPFAWAMAQRVTSSGEWLCSSPLAWAIWSGVMAISVYFFKVSHITIPPQLFKGVLALLVLRPSGAFGSPGRA